MTKIFISAGHYPQAPGVRAGETTEHDEAARWVAAMLKMEPRLYAVPTGVLRQKAMYINKHIDDTSVAVEVHFGDLHWSVVDKTVHGCSALYDPGRPRSKELADVLQEAMELTFPRLRGVVPGWHRGDVARGLHHYLARVSCPSVIIMPELLIRYKDIDAFRDDCCTNLVNAMRRHLWD